MFEDFRLPFQRQSAAHSLLLLVLVFAVAGCKHILPVDTVPLDNVGINFDSIQRMKALKITAPEVAEISQVKQAGMPDDGCVELLQIYRDRGVPFNAGDAVAGLIQVGIGRSTIFELAK